MLLSLHLVETPITFCSACHMQCKFYVCHAGNYYFTRFQCLMYVQNILLKTLLFCYFSIICLGTTFYLAGWPQGRKVPKGPFCPLGQSALWRRLLHQNGTFVPPAPSTRLCQQVKTDFHLKMGRSEALFSSIRMIPRIK